ncbi:flippase [Salinimicrobium sp. TH3]|uniref:flippase n=1 Tax=Salinimicrobium sp. TH3 TaxID=2997342 RepID=UPI002276B758|nr:flippase [Salinimicrobium sp. TH3]MCY2687802.1 flippase [Salinimicrobium sp. TH3]
MESINKFFSENSSLKDIFSKFSSSLIVRVVGLIVSFLVSMFLGRLLGPSDFGVMNLAIQITSFILVISMWGLPQVLIKEVAIGFGSRDKEHIRNMLGTAYIINGVIGIVCTIILILCSSFIATKVFDSFALTFPLIIFSAFLIPQIITRILSSSLIGFDKIWQSNVLDQTSSGIIWGIFLIVYWLSNFPFNLVGIALLFGLSRLVVMVFGIVYWKNIYGSYNFFRPTTFKGKEMLKTGGSLLIVNASLLISTSADTIMLGWLSTTKEVGYYSVAAKLALLTSFLLQITISVLGPKIAVLYNDKKTPELEKLLQSVSKALFILGFLSLIILVIFGKTVLGFWGEDFTPAYSVLVILAIGQFFNIASGPVGNLLVMTSHEKILRNITATTVLLNLLLNFYFITRYGATGAAYATSITTILNMILCYYFVRIRIGLKLYKWF